MFDHADSTIPFDGEEAGERRLRDQDARDTGGVHTLRGQRRRSRTPLSAAERDALRDEADAADGRVRELVRRRRAGSRDMAKELHEVARRRLHEVHGFRDVVAYAQDRGVAESRSQVGQMILVVERLRDRPLLRAAFERDEADWSKLREGLRELERLGPEGDEAAVLAQVLAHSSRDLEDLYREARGEPRRRRRVFDLAPEDEASWEQALLALRARDPAITPSRALGVMARAFVQGQGQTAGTGDENDGDERERAVPAGTRLVLHLGVPAGVTSARGATKAQAALAAAAGAAAATLETRDGPVEVSRALLEAALCDAEVHDVRRGPSRITRTVPPKIARFVRDRDHGRCKVPGCSSLGSLHVHHEPGRWVVGHDPDKMLIACPTHHHMRHEGLLAIDPVPGGFVFTSAAGGPPVFVPLDRGVALPAPPAGDSPAPGSAPVRSAVERTPPPPQSGEDARAAAIREAEEDAVKALVVLETRRRDARASVRHAMASLTSRGATIDASALLTEALRLSPSPAPRRPG